MLSPSRNSIPDFWSISSKTILSSKAVSLIFWSFRNTNSQTHFQEKKAASPRVLIQSGCVVFLLSRRVPVFQESFLLFPRIKLNYMLGVATVPSASPASTPWIKILVSTPNIPWPSIYLQLNWQPTQRVFRVRKNSLPIVTLWTLSLPLTHGFGPPMPT